MSHFVKIEYNIKDVEIEKPKKKRGWRSNANQSPPKTSSEPKKVISTPSREEKNIINSSPQSPALSNRRQSEVIVSPREQPIITPRGVSKKENSSPLIQKRPQSESRRMNLSEKKAKPDAPWQFSSVGLDREMTMLEQDLKISKYKLKHPSPYDDNVPKSVPVTEEREHHHAKTDKTLHLRERLDSKTHGKIVNNSLPYHPGLKEVTDYGIHGRRWNVMTALSDDPDRLRPVHSVQTKSHMDFDQTFNSCLSKSRKEHTIEISKHDIL